MVYSLDKLMQAGGIPVLPVGIKEAFENYVPSQEKSILWRPDLIEMCEKYGVDSKNQERLFLALDEIEQNDIMRELYQFLIWDLCQERNRNDNNFYSDFEMHVESEYADCYLFLLAFALIRPCEESLIRRGVPKEIYGDIPEHRLGYQLQKYQKTGDCTVADFPWDKNFYSRSIYRFDRFYFLPVKFEDPFMLYKNTSTGRVQGAYKAGVQVLVDGQIVDDERRDGKDLPMKVAFTTITEEDEKQIRCNYMNPCGFISDKVVTMKKSDWKKVLESGEWMLAMHVPSGPGYDPAHLQSSYQIAMDFYEKYYPDYPIRGFFSESWLYDNRLSFILSENSGIVQTHRRFFNYSIGEDGSMMKLEVWGNEDIDIETARTKSELEKRAVATMKAGNRFCTTSMVVLREDVSCLEVEQPYITEEDIKELNDKVKKTWNPY